MAGNDIRGNHAPNGGGLHGTSSGSSTATILNNAFVGNTADYQGGAIYCTSVALTVAGNTIVGNTAGESGGGMMCGAPATIANNTIAGNSAAQGGALLLSNYTMTIANNIVAFNSPGIRRFSGTLLLNSNDVFGNTTYGYFGLAAGQGDITVDPLFVDRAGGDYHLALGSPCIDAGYDAAVQTGWVDMDGQARIQGAHVDIGADEFAWSEVLGACCVHWACSLQLEEACAAAGGTFRGAGTTCAADTCRCSGDGNCDGVVNWQDIDYLIAGQNDNFSAWAALFVGGSWTCPFLSLDTNVDGHVNWRDIDPFIALMNTTCRP